MRLTKIVCTLGPASNSEEKVLALLEKGMNVARFNFSHGTHESHGELIRLVKGMNEKHGHSVALLLDTKGAEIRTGEVDSPVAIKKGQEVIFKNNLLAAEKAKEGRIAVMVNYDGFVEDAKHAEKIIVDNGQMTFDFISAHDGYIVARSNDDGSIGSRRHINLPGADVKLPAMTEKDWEDVKFGIENEFDFVALSFVKTADEVREVVEFLKKQKSTMRVIAKIETRQSVAVIDEIIAVSDGIMVARGDLGAEIPFERIPAIQDMIVEKCVRAGKPVIVATHMLESMIKNPMPTRAEVTDIAHAATTYADATMLSGETANGEHPIEAVTAMSSTLLETESLLPHGKQMTDREQSDYLVRAEAAVSMALSIGAPAIIAITKSGKTAEAVSSLRSSIPIIACTQSPLVQRALQLRYGVVGLEISIVSDPEATVTNALQAAKDAGLVRSGERIVLLSDTLASGAMVSTVQLRVVS